jgi:hypothetical protein
VLDQVPIIPQAFSVRALVALVRYPPFLRRPSGARAAGRLRLAA